MLSLVVIRARDVERLATFYEALGLRFTKEQHGTGPQHLSTTIGETVFEIYPSKGAEESTASARLGFSVPCLASTLDHLHKLDASLVAASSDTAFGRRAVVRDFEGHKVELYEKSK